MIIMRLGISDFTEMVLYGKDFSSLVDVGVLNFE